jgi:purine-nucleoside phosphorylase
MFDKIKYALLNFGLKSMTVDEKIVRLFLRTKASNVNEIVIIPIIKQMMSLLLSKLHDKKVHGKVYSGLLNGVKVSMIRSLIGAPNAATIVESLRRCKTKVILRVDCCGGILNQDKKISIGDILIPNLSYCGDGTSPHYLLKYKNYVNNIRYIQNPFQESLDRGIGSDKIFISEPDSDLNQIILNQATSQGLDQVKNVDFWTTDALFCETNEFITTLSKIGVQGIDMENSILFLLSKLHDIKTTSILSVSDLPTHPKYDLLNSNIVNPNIEKGMKNSIDLLFNILPEIYSKLI